MASSSLESQLRMHIRVLYVLIVSLVIVLLAGTWITQNQLRHLQDNTPRGIVSKREVIEFRLVEDEDGNDVKIEPISPSKRIAMKKNHSQVVGFYKSQLKSGKVRDDDNDTVKAKSDKKGSGRYRRKRQVDMGGEKEDFDLTKYVWLTSYSRISVSWHAFSYK